MKKINLCILFTSCILIANDNNVSNNDSNIKSTYIEKTKTIKNNIQNVEQIKEKKLKELKKKLLKLKLKQLKKMKDSKNSRDKKLKELKYKLKLLKEKNKSIINKKELQKITKQIEELENNFIIRNNSGYFKTDIDKRLFYELMRQIFTKDELVKIRYDKDQYILEFYNDNIIVGGYIKRYIITLKENNLFNIVKVEQKIFDLEGKENLNYIKNVYRYYNDKNDIQQIIKHIMREINNFYKKEE